MFKLFWKKYFIAFLIGILPFLISAKVFLLTDPPVWPDEVMFTSLAKNFADKGTIATNLYGSNEFGYDKGALSHHPLYIIILSFWGKFFGFSIQSVRSLSLLTGFMTLIVCFLILTKLFNKPFYTFLGLLLITTDPWFTQITHLGRMEILTILFIVSAFLFFLHVMPKKQIEMKDTIILGIFAACAFLTHPIGIVCTIILCFLILISKKTRRIKITFCLIIGSITLFAWSIWLASISPLYNYFFKQWQWEILRKSTSTGIVNSLFYVKHLATILFLTYLISFIYAIYLTIRHKILYASVILIPCLITSFMAYLGKEQWYLAYLQPWAAFLYIFNLNSLVKKNSIKNLFILLGGIIIFINMMLSPQQFYLQSLHINNPQDYEAFGLAINKIVPVNSSILVSSIPDPTYILWGKRGEDRIYQFFLFPMSTSLSYQKLLDTIDYVVINQAFEPILYSYLKTNTEKFERVQAGGYQIELYTLTAKNNRTHVSE